jgi:hypothetical protein
LGGFGAVEKKSNPKKGIFDAPFRQAPEKAASLRCFEVKNRAEFSNFHST